MIPVVIDHSPKGDRAYDIYSRLLKDRVVFLTGAIDELTALEINAQLLFLEAENPSKDITMYINSGGGSVMAGLSIYDTINYIKCDVKTICTGQACSMGAFLLSAGAKGKRLAFPNSRIMIHQIMSGTHGQATDIVIQTNELLRLKKLLNESLASHCNKPLDVIEKDTERDYFMTAKDAINYGLIDNVVSKK